MVTLDEPKKRIKYVRHLAGLKQDDFADYGIPPGTIRTWESSNNLSRKAANRLVKMFNKCGIEITADWLLTGEGTAPAPDSFNINKYDEIEFFKRRNADQEIITFCSPVNYYQFIEPGDLVAAFIVNDPDQYINKHVVIETKGNLQLIARLISIDETTSSCECYEDQSLELKDSKTSFNYNRIGAITWIRK